MSEPYDKGWYTEIIEDATLAELIDNGEDPTYQVVEDQWTEDLTVRTIKRARIAGRPNRDRAMVSFYLARSGKAAIAERATKTGQTMADTYRELLRIGLEHVK